MVIASSSRAFAALSVIALLLVPMRAGAAPSPVAPDSKPSRAAEKGCAWERLSDAKLGLDAWVQRCDFGKRKIDFVVGDHSLAQHYSDSTGAPELAIGVIDLLPAETPEHGIQRVLATRTDKKLFARCVLVPFHAVGGLPGPPPAGVDRYSFEPNPAFKKALKAKADPNNVPGPPCGAWGEDPDGVQYFEAQPASGVRKVLFVRVGQEEPLFDEATLRLR
jgi:hypothetical protein